MRYPDGKEVELLADYLAWRHELVYETEDDDGMCGIRDFFFRCLYDFYYFKDRMDFDDFVSDNLYAGDAEKVDDYII